MKKIFVFGSLNMDMVINTPYIPQNGETLHGSGFMYNPGGKGANQAVACSKLGGNTYMIGKVGKDMFADQLIEALNGYNVNTENVFKSETVTSGIAMILKCDNDNRIVLDAGSNFDITLEEVKSVLDTQTEPGDLWIAQLETPMEIVEESFKLAKEKGLYTIFNPAPAKKIKDETYAFIDLIVLNQSECEIMTGTYPNTEEDYEAICQYFSARGVKEMIITLGSKGSALYTNGKILKFQADKVKAVDTTAAGDSYIGSLAYSLSTGRKLEDSIGEASKVAALTVMKHGAQSAIPTREELLTYMNN